MKNEAKKVILCVLERIKYKADLTPDNPSKEVKKDLKIKKEALEELVKEEEEIITAPKITDYQRELKWLSGKQIIFTYQQDGLACNLAGDEFVSVLDKLREMGAIKDFRKIGNSSPINYKLLLPKNFNKRYQKIKNELAEDAEQILREKEDAKPHAKLIREGLEKIDERQKEKEEIKEEVKKELFGEDKIKRPTFEEITKEGREWMEELNERNHQERLQNKYFKQQRILNSKEDKRIHAINTIIEHIKPFYLNQKNISIDYYYFNFEDRMDDSKRFEQFLEELKYAGCFKGFKRQNYTGGVKFHFFEVNVDKLEKYKRNFSKGSEENKIKVEVEGLQDGLKAIAKAAEAKKDEKKNKFPYKLPAGTKWENIIIKFLDEENVLISVRKKEFETNFKDMGFVDNRWAIPRPNEGWIFLRILAKHNGEITPTNPDAKDTYKKQKELVSKTLQFYFTIDYDPFYPYDPYPPYKHERSYKIKIQLIPPPVKEQKSSIIDKKSAEDELNEELEEFYKDQTPQVYDEWG